MLFIFIPYTKNVLFICLLIYFYYLHLLIYLSVSLVKSQTTRIRGNSGIIDLAYSVAEHFDDFVLHRKGEPYRLRKKLKML